MGTEERDRQPAALEATTDDQFAMVEEVWEDEDYHVFQRAEAPPPDPWDDEDAQSCAVQGDCDWSIAKPHRIEGEPPKLSSDKLTECAPAPSCQAQDQDQLQKEQLSYGAFESRKQLHRQPGADDPVEGTDFSPGGPAPWRAFMKLIRAIGPRSEPKPPPETTADAHAETAGSAIIHEQGTDLSEPQLLDPEWAEEEDWLAGADSDLAGSETAAPDGIDDDEGLYDFEADAQQNPWVTETRNEPSQTRSARAKAAEIIHLLDLSKVHHRDAAIDFLTSLFEELHHPATFRAIRDLLSSDGDFDNFRRVVELRREWAERPDWWRSRSYTRLVEESEL